MEERFYIDGEVIPFIVNKPVKSLGKWYNSTLNNRGQVEELVIMATNTIDKHTFNL